MLRSTTLLATAMFALTISQVPAMAADSWKSFNSDGIKFDYLDYSGLAKIDKLKAFPLASPDDVPDGVAPAHTEISFGKSEAKICVYPTTEQGKKNFAKAYPPVDDAIKSLGKILKDQKSNPGEVPYLPWADWATPFMSQIKYLNSNGIKWVRFIGEYQMEEDVISNDRLVYVAQGLTADGKNYVSVYLPIHAKGLPEKSDIAKWSKDKAAKFSKNYATYVKGEKAKLDQIRAADLQPSLANLDKLTSSIKLGK